MPPAPIFFMIAKRLWMTDFGSNRPVNPCGSKADTRGKAPGVLEDGCPDEGNGLPVTVQNLAVFRCGRPHNGQVKVVISLLP
jgi:hypothetical protein